MSSHLNCVQTFHVFFPNLSFSPKFATLVKISNYQQTIFRHVIWQAIHYLLPKSLFSPNLSFLKESPTVNMPLFVISFQYLAKPLLNFGILAIFAEICHFLILTICRRFPFLSSHLNFAKPLTDFSRNFFDFTKNSIFVKTHNYLHACFVILF